MPKTNEFPRQEPKVEQTGVVAAEKGVPQLISFPLIIETKAGQEKSTASSSLYGELVGRDGFILHRINLQGVLWRNQIVELASRFNFTQQLNETLQSLNTDHFMVDLKFDVPTEQVKTRKPTATTRLRIREGEEGSGVFVPQGFNDTQFLLLDIPPKNFQIILDKSIYPNKLTIRASE